MWGLNQNNSFIVQIGTSSYMIVVIYKCTRMYDDLCSSWLLHLYAITLYMYLSQCLAVTPALYGNPLNVHPDFDNICAAFITYELRAV